MSAADLIAQAQNFGIKIYSQNGQLQVDMPWALEALPEPARAALGEVKRRRAEVLAHFVLSSPALDLPLLLEALRAHGVSMSVDQDGRMQVHVNPASSRCDDTLLSVFGLVDRNWETVAAYIAEHPQVPMAPG